MDTRASSSIASSLPRDRVKLAAIPESPVQGDLSRAIVTRRTSYEPGHHVKPHWHARAQFVFAVEGTMRVRTSRRVWIVPPSRALWVPAHTAHEIHMYGTVKMHSLYVNDASGAGMPSSCVVLSVTPLLRELIVRAAALPAAYHEDGDDGLLMRLLMAEIRRLAPCALDLPLPESPDLMQLCERILADFSTRRPCGLDADDMQTTTRTLYRRFLRETGITFARWKQQARLLESIRRLAEGVPVTTVAIDLGYESPSAFSTMFRRALGIAPRAFTAGEDSALTKRKRR
ncbi:MAG: helix-turn-helix transcriptional regulator [Betaproteobacteria bacterium]|nr:helix-turn-helix transcriptional regulator [Betaproteobacteria bacterium]